jgi:hypothetical protein
MELHERDDRVSLLNEPTVAAIPLRPIQQRSLHAAGRLPASHIRCPI